MINKQNLWFITLFSMILVLGVYYVTLADESLNFENIIDDSSPVISVYEADQITALKVANEEEVLNEIAMYENIILNSASTSSEISEAYENLQVIQNNVIKSEEIEKIILDNFNLESFIKINNDQIEVTISSNDHNTTLANNIIMQIQSLYKNQMYITVTFS